MTQLKTAVDLQHLLENMENLAPRTEVRVAVTDIRQLILRIDEAETSIAEMRKTVLNLNLKLSLVE